MSDIVPMQEQELIECVPNFSEGRRQDVIDRIIDAINAYAVNVLNVHSDPDHHRTVVTFIGSSSAVSDAMLAGTRIAAQLIDLRQHRGQHPRIGAVDVIPFVPLRGVSFTQAVELARSFAQRVAVELQLPVYLYDRAALRRDRRDLAQIRRPQYEGLCDKIAVDPFFAPDFGPRTLGPAGAVVVGARGPLIAFNAYLSTDNVDIARAVARAVRASSGGLPHVKALGLLVHGQAQVSINLTDYRRTGLSAVLAAVQDQAARFNVQVTHTEIVGLTPRQALLDFAAQQLKLRTQVNPLVLEQQIGLVTGDFSDIQFE